MGSTGFHEDGFGQGSLFLLDRPSWQDGSVQSVNDFLDRVEQRRIRVGSAIPSSRRARFGQFFTPGATAALLAQIAPTPTEPWRMLDPGAGIGTLSAALIARWLTETDLPSLSVTAYEADPRLIAALTETFDEGRTLAKDLGRTFHVEVREADFILDPPAGDDANVVLMNPPYGKLPARDPKRDALAEAEPPVRVTNLYAAFLAQAMRALRSEGHLVAITPRSFANGPYFHDLRTYLLAQASFERIHVFEARNRVFADADVLQENVVFSLCKGVAPGTVIISSSLDTDGRITSRECEHDAIVHPGDAGRFVRIPLDDTAIGVAEQIAKMPSTLSDLGLTVSTGRVVDFRSREHLRENPGASTVPLIYPQNLRVGRVVWPVRGRKPQALVRTTSTESLLLPNEHYVVVKRLSSKEEARRVVAAVASPDAFAQSAAVAFENHLNVFHDDCGGLDPDVAVGLTTYLNSQLVDEFIRQFNGHTQVNATDLRSLRYPSRDQLGELGRAAQAGSTDHGDRAVMEQLVVEQQPQVAAA